MDLIVRRARRRHHADLVDIGIAEGRIQRIEPRLAGGATREIDAGGCHWLVGHGVTFIRSYVDVDSIVGLTALEGACSPRASAAGASPTSS